MDNEWQRLTQERQRLDAMMRQFEQRTNSSLDKVQQFKQSSDQLRQQSQSLRMGDLGTGRMVQSIYLDTSSEAPTGNIGTGAGIGMKMPHFNRMNSDQQRRHGVTSNDHPSDDTLFISTNQQSFDQYQDSITTKRLRMNDQFHDPNDLVDI